MNQIIEAPAIGQDFAAIKQRQQATWASGDFAVIGTTLQIVGESLAEAVDVCAGERVLDVAAGNGNATLAAARRFAEVTSTDYVPALLEKGRARAAAEGLAVRFQVADAEDLPFSDGSFDVVLSTFGAMFTPDHGRPAREMLRVVRRGGRIGLANWTPEGFIGRLFKVVGAYVPPPTGLKSPALWGTESHIVALFGPKAAQTIMTATNLPMERRVSQLTDAEVLQIREMIDRDYTVEGDLRRETAMNIKRLMDLGCYRGLRHRRGLPVRGQRTHTNARTRKGPAKAIAGKKK